MTPEQAKRLDELEAAVDRVRSLALDLAAKDRDYGYDMTTMSLWDAAMDQVLVALDSTHRSPEVGVFEGYPVGSVLLTETDIRLATESLVPDLAAVVGVTSDAAARELRAAGEALRAGSISAV